MNHHEPAHHGAFGSSATTLPFAPAEVEAFHVQDKKAATAIVGLMVSIFVMGVVGYLLVCYWVS